MDMGHVYPEKATIPVAKEHVKTNWKLTLMTRKPCMYLTVGTLTINCLMV